MVNKEELIEIVKNSMSYANVCKQIGISSVGGNFNKIKKYIKLYDINIDHFTGQGWNTGDRYKFFGKLIPLDKILQGEYPTFPTSHLRKRLIKEGIKQEKCEICGITDWNNKKISFHLDHIDGDNTNHKLDNLRILCPNCHSQTETYGNKKRSKKIYYSKLELLTAIYESKNYTEVKKKLNLSRSGDNEVIKNILFEYNVKFIEKEKIQDIILKEIEIENNNNKLKKEVKKRIRRSKDQILINYCECGKEIEIRSKRCPSCDKINQRKVKDRPTISELILMVKELGYCETGRKYNVSDNTIRKWLKKAV